MEYGLEGIQDLMVSRLEGIERESEGIGRLRPKPEARGTRGREGGTRGREGPPGHAKTKGDQKKDIGIKRRTSIPPKRQNAKGKKRETCGDDVGLLAAEGGHRDRRLGNYTHRLGAAVSKGPRGGQPGVLGASHEHSPLASGGNRGLAIKDPDLATALQNARLLGGVGRVVRRGQHLHLAARSCAP